VGGSDLIAELETTEAAAMEAMEEESVGGDVAVSTDPLVDDAAECGSRLSSNLWISLPTTSSSSAACVSSLHALPGSVRGIGHRRLQFSTSIVRGEGHVSRIRWWRPGTDLGLGSSV
jgi:hypothetical protein